jgi:transcriptional regulator with XRE-family HTH domain
MTGVIVQVGEMRLMRAMRIGRGWSGMQVTGRSGIDRSRLSALERGLDEPRPLEREKLAAALGVEPAAVDQVVPLFVRMPASRAAAAQPVVQRRQRQSGLLGTGSSKATAEG